MEGVLPLSFGLSDDSARIIGAYVRSGLIDVVRPPLDAIAAGIGGILFGLGRVLVAVVDGGSAFRVARLRVVETNDTMLGGITATWVVGFLSLGTLLQMLEVLRRMAWLDGRSHLHLHQIIDAVQSVEGAVAAFAVQVNAIGSFVVTLLQAILDQLRAGLRITGTITVVVQSGGLGDFLASLDLWKLLGLLVLVTVGLAVVVGFLYAVSAALATFGAGAIKAALAIGLLTLALIPLMTTIAGFGWWQLLKIGLGFLGIAVFVAALGKAFSFFTTDLAKVVPHLRTFFAAMRELMTTIVGFDRWQLLRIAAGFAEITLFVAALGWAFTHFTTDLRTVVPHLTSFFTAITDLMRVLAAFGGWDYLRIGVGFALIAGFIWVLSRALESLTQRAIDAMAPLTSFLTSMRAMLTELAGLGVTQLLAIAGGFVLVALFVYGLSLALNTLTAQAVAALPGLVQLITVLSQMAAAMAAMGLGEVVTLGVGLALVAAFVWAVAAALVYAAGPLATLATIMQGAAAAVEALGNALGRVGDFFGSVGGFLGDAWDSISSPIDMSSILSQASGAAPTAAVLAPTSVAPPPPAAASAAFAGLPGRPAGGAMPAVGGAGSVDQSVTVSGLTVNLNAERLEAGAGQILTDEIVAALQTRLGDLRATQDFRAGGRPAQV